MSSASGVPRVGRATQITIACFFGVLAGECVRSAAQMLTAPPPVERMRNQPLDYAVSAPNATETISADRARQVALATLIAQDHEIRPEQIVFRRDTTRPGHAIQQFSKLFGWAIREDRCPPRGLAGLDQ